MIFIDAFFANVDQHSQINDVIYLIDDFKANIIHWFFTKCKRVIKSVLAAKLYAMTNKFDADSVIKSIIQRIFNIFLSMILWLIQDHFMIVSSSSKSRQKND
jgi:hypothetical protein